VFRERHRQALIEAAQDPKALIQYLPDVERDIARLGVVPKGLPELAETWWSSGEPEFQAAAARIVDMLDHSPGSELREAGAVPPAFDLPPELRDRSEMIVRLMDAGVPDEIAVRRVGKTHDPGGEADESIQVAGLDDAIRQALQGVGTDAMPEAAKGLPDWIFLFPGILRRLFEASKRTRPVPQAPEVEPAQPPEPDQGREPTPPTPELSPAEPAAPPPSHQEVESAEPTGPQPTPSPSHAQYPSAKELHNLPPSDEEYFVTIQNRRFLRGPEGTADIGRAGPVEDAELGVRIARRDLPHVDTPRKSSEAKDAGYENGVELTVDVASKWQEMRSGHPDAETGNDRLILVKRNGANKVAVVELERFAGEDFYRVVTSGLRSNESVDSLPLIRKRTSDSP
jgi:hypothetical protein